MSEKSKKNFIIEKMFSTPFNFKDFNFIEIPNDSIYRVIIDGCTDEAINNADKIQVSVEDNKLRIYVND